MLPWQEQSEARRADLVEGEIRQFRADAVARLEHEVVGKGIALRTDDGIQQGEGQEVGGDHGEGAVALQAQGNVLLQAETVVQAGWLVDVVGRAQRMDTGHHQAGEMLEHGDVALGQRPAWFPVDDAEAAEVETLRGGQRSPGVEADARFALHIGIVPEARVEGGVGHLEDSLPQDRVGAERIPSRRLPGIEADARAKPLALVVEDGNERDWRLEVGCSGGEDFLEYLVRTFFQQSELVDVGLPGMLVRGIGWGCHAGLLGYCDVGHRQSMMSLCLYFVERGLFPRLQR